MTNFRMTPVIKSKNQEQMTEFIKAYQIKILRLVLSIFKMLNKEIIESDIFKEDQDLLQKAGGFKDSVIEDDESILAVGTLATEPTSTNDQPNNTDNSQIENNNVEVEHLQYTKSFVYS